MKLEDLFGSLSLDTFSRDFWGKKRFLSAVVNEELKKILSWDMIVAYLSTPEFYEKASVLLRSDSFSDAIEPKSLDEVLKGIDDGYTLQIRKLQNVLPKNSTLMSLARSLEEFLLAPLDSITFFYSTPDSSPTAIHKDIPEIFSIQIAGKKRWRLANEKCLTNQMSYNDSEFNEWQEYILEPGNFIYSPSYYPHQVKCVEEPSISVALIYSNIQFVNFLSFITEDPIIKEATMQPIPILSTPGSFNNATHYANQFVSLLSERLASLDTGMVLKQLKSQLEESLIYQGCSRNNDHE